MIRKYHPDPVLFEKVERNLTEFTKIPPIIPAPKAAPPQTAGFVESSTTVSIEPLEYDSNYYKISGNVDGALVGEETDIIIQVNDAYYKAYHTGSNGYVVYMKKEDMPSCPVEIEVLTEDQGIYKVIQTKKIEKLLS